MKVEIDVYERWPTYEVRVNDVEWWLVQPNADLTEDELAEWQRVEKEYDEWQRRLAAKLASARAATGDGESGTSP